MQILLPNAKYYLNTWRIGKRAIFDDFLTVLCWYYSRMAVKRDAAQKRTK